MPTTRKKVIKTVYKDEDDSEPENADFSDSGSEAVISQQSSSEDDNEDVPDGPIYSEDKKKKKKVQKIKPVRTTTFQKSIINKANEQRRLHLTNDGYDSDHKDEPKINIKDLTDADKLLPSILNLSESDSSDDETPKPTRSPTHTVTKPEDIETEIETEYKDVWSNNLQQSEEIAQKAFLELEKHKTKLEETKQSIEQYTIRNENSRESDVKDLLALGEELPSVSQIKVKKRRNVKARNDSDSDIEDWEEVAEGKTLPQQGLQLVVDFPDAIHRKKKKLDVEMMMKRKINRVKKEYQVYMHKVHVLCWLGHGNFVSQVLNDQEVMSAALSLIPSKECYPGERVDMKYVEQITTWFKDKLKVTYDKHEGKYRPKAPPLKSILIEQIKSRIVTSKKYVVYIFVSMLRAVGLQCRVMLNFTTLPIKPPATELCSLSTKSNVNENSKEKKDVKSKECKKKNNKNTTKIPQLDGNYDSFSDSDFDNIIQLDGNDDAATSKGVKSPAKGKTKIENKVVEDVSPPKRPRRNLSIKKVNSELNKSNDIKSNENNETQSNKLIKKEDVKHTKGGKEVIGKVTRKSLSLRRNKPDIENEDNSSLSNVKDTKVGKEVIGKVTKKSLSLIRKKPDIENEDNSSLSNAKDTKVGKEVIGKVTSKLLSLRRNKPDIENEHNSSTSIEVKIESAAAKKLSLPKTRNTRNNDKPDPNPNDLNSEAKYVNIPKIVVTENQGDIASEYFNNSSVGKPETERGTRARKRSHTSNLNEKQNNTTQNDSKKPRAKSVPGKSSNKSKYFDNTTDKNDKSEAIDDEDSLRVNHKDLVKSKSKPKNDVRNDLVKIIKKRVKDAKLDTKKGKTNKSSDEDSDYLPEVSESEKPTATKKTKAKGSSRKIDRRVLSTDDEAPSHKIDVWCEIYVEELEQWIAVDVIKGRVHCVNEIYRGATHPVNYVVGWDNNNYLKDLTRRYVPHWNTVTRKQRVDPAWWDTAVQPWLGPKTPRDREEDESLDRMQLDAPLPKSIAEYKNHPLYALKRHLLKFEAIYPPDAATLGFVRGEAVYARDCVYVCRSRDTWLKEAKVVRLGEKPYKVVKARPKWDKLSNKLITDKPLEVFGPWQVQDYEPPVAENGIVPRNAYGNVELFKDCMLPKGTVHIKLPGLNRVARKLNIDCAPAMTGFDFNGGWSHPVYDGFVVCEEFEEIITNAWHEDQLEQERKEIEKLEARVYGNWKRLIKGLLIRERLKLKYGFSEPTTSQETKKKSTGPRLAVNKKCLKK